MHASSPTRHRFVAMRNRRNIRTGSGDILCRSSAISLGEIQHKITQFLRVVAFNLFTQGSQQALNDGAITIERPLCYSTMTSHPVVKFFQQRWPFDSSGTFGIMPASERKAAKRRAPVNAVVYRPLRYLSLPRASRALA